MGKGAIGCGVLSAVGLIAVVTTIASHNRLVEHDERVQHAWRSLDASYADRSNAATELATALRGTLDDATLNALAAASNDARGLRMEAAPVAQALSEFEIVQRRLDAAIDKVGLALARASAAQDSQAREVLERLDTIDLAIASDRERFDAETLAYNRTRRRFPTLFLATLRGFGDRPYLAPPQSKP